MTVCRAESAAAAAFSAPLEDLETEGRYRLPFLVVGVGASAGGIEALINLFEHVPADTGMAFVVVLHLAPDQKSHLPEILARHTAMSVLSIASGMQPQPNTIHVLGANAGLRIAHGRPVPARIPVGTTDGYRHFFSVACHRPEKPGHWSGSVGDGRRWSFGPQGDQGRRRITIVQSPDSARFPDMPRTSLSGDHVDIVLPPDAIGSHLALLAREFRNPELRKLDDEAQATADSRFGRILEILKNVSGIDFRLYKSNTIRRRIARRMLLHQIDNLAAYEAFLKANPSEIRELQEDSLINVTRFFRDPDVFEALKVFVYPQLFDSRSRTSR